MIINFAANLVFKFTRVKFYNNFLKLNHSSCQKVKLQLLKCHQKLRKEHRKRSSLIKSHLQEKFKHRKKMEPLLKLEIKKLKEKQSLEQ